MISPAQEMRIADNVRRVRDGIADAALRAGRDSSEITLVAVCKYVDATVTRVLIDAGCQDLGESRPQQLWQKESILRDAVPRWHLIGHLQRNKARRTAHLADWIHSVDSLELLATIDRCASGRDTPLNILLEVNISGDTAKHGFDTTRAAEAVAAAAACEHIQLRGLMGMAGAGTTPASARAEFRRLATLREQLLRHVADPTVLAELSMGMSGDYAAAIAEGATMVRIGSTLFDGVIS